MTRTDMLRYCALFAGATLPAAASAFFFIIPIPNLAKPPALNALIEALEKSDETKAVAYVSEDKTFGSKYWAWGHYAGHVTQEEANRTAMSRCEAALAKAKAEKAGGKELYDFGSKRCELYDFQNKTVSARVNQAPAPVAAPVPANQVPPPAAAAAVAGQAPPQTAPPTPAEQAYPAVPPYPYAATQSEQPAPLPSASQDTPPPSAQRPSSAPGAAPTLPATATSPTAHTVPPPAVVPSQLPSTHTDKAPPVESSTARRLRELNDLLKQGLITESEYNEKRKAILSAL